MPNLTEYNAPPGLGLQPSEVGESAVVSSARRIGAFAHETAQDIDQVGQRFGSAVKDAGDVYVKHEEFKDVSKINADFTAKQDQVISGWNDFIKAHPNDPNAAAEFREQTLEPALETFGSDAATEAGQKLAQSYGNQLRQHMDNTMRADMSTAAGNAVKVDFEKTVNSLSNTVMNDPSALDHALQIADSSVNALAGSAPNLSASDASRVRSEGSLHAKEQIVKAAAYGAIQNTGKMPDWLSDPKYSQYVNGMELKQFESAAKTQQKQNMLMDRQATLLKKQQAEMDVRTSSAKTITDNVTFDPNTGKPIIDPKFFKQALDIAKQNPDAPNAAETVRTMFSWGESQQNKNEKPIDDPVVKSDLMTRMFSGDNPTSTLDLMKARAQGKISDQSFQAMHGLVQELEQTPIKGPVWHDTVDAVKGQLVLSGVGLPGKDLVGEQNYAKWAQSFIPQYLSMSRNNTLPPNALDIKDPKSMISQSMAPFQRTIQQRTQDYLSTLQGLPGGGPAPMVSGHEVPTQLRGIAALQYNPSKDLWRDQTTGTTYDKNGNPVKP